MPLSSPYGYILIFSFSCNLGQYIRYFISSCSYWSTLRMLLERKVLSLTHQIETVVVSSPSRKHSVRTGKMPLGSEWWSYLQDCSSIARSTRVKKSCRDFFPVRQSWYKPWIVLLRASSANMEIASADCTTGRSRTVEGSSAPTRSAWWEGEATEAETEEGSSSSCRGGSGRIGRRANRRESELGDGGARGL